MIVFNTANQAQSLKVIANEQASVLRYQSKNNSNGTIAPLSFAIYEM